MKKKILPAEYIREHLSFDENGNLIWITKIKGRTQFKEAGYVASNTKGFKSCRVGLLGDWYSKAAVVWLLHYGEQISDDFIIDHIDGNALNNHVSNLSKKSVAENNKNKKKQKNNKTGITGVWMRGESWVAKACGKLLYKGSDFFEACCARRSADISFGFTKRHGK